MSAAPLRAAIVGGSGYTGGELLRLLLFHPEVEVTQITSERLAGRFAHHAHPNLRGATRLKFSAAAELEACDVLFACLPHGQGVDRVEVLEALAPRIVDLSADFRLRDREVYRRRYGREHPRPDRLSRYAYGIPEVNREAIAAADRVACAGCNATATILALRPLLSRGLAASAVVEVKAGSSEAGNAPSEGSHHPERSGAVRSYRLTGHRHVAEIEQAFPGAAIHFSATAIEMVRGILATCHVFPEAMASEKDLWRLYREDYGAEPFVRIVKERSGIHRYPDPKLLAGTNYCDVGFERDPDSGRVVVVAAIDNLMKGAAGQAVQCFNLMCGFPETTGLEFPGLHPI